MKIPLYLSVCLSLGPLLAGSLGDASLTLASEGRSRYTIIIPQDATPSLRAAAEELQRCLRDASKAQVPIRHDGESAIEGPVISLGNSTVASRESVSLEGVADEGYRIVSKGENLYILGYDTREGEWSKRGGTSHGTANGVYSFLEEALAVRWLMPGELGRDVPLQPNVTVEIQDHIENPKFSWRLLSHIFDYTRGGYRERTQAWADRLRLGSSVRFEYNHNWDWLRQDPTYYKEHPEWFAMIDGKRKRPTNHYLKLETTNPELIRTFADKAIATLKADPRPNTYSIAPADGRSWSQSPESLALYDPPYRAEGMEAVDPTEADKRRDHPVMTSLVLKWYHDIAEIVAKEYPEGRLGGYIYGDYLWPSTKMSMKLPENFIPVLCGPNYGFQLYTEAYQKRFKEVLDAWTKVAPEEWYYFDLPNQFFRQDMLSSDVSFPGGIGIVTPPGLKILETIFPAILQAGMKGAYIYGEPTWSNSALANYVVAKLLWDPSRDPRALANDWLLRAYGPDAGKEMIAFYDRLEAIYEEYGKTKSIGYKLKADYLKEIYGPHIGELEKLYERAVAKAVTPVQRERLSLIGGNLTLLSWRLKNAGMLPNLPTPEENAAVAALVEEQHAELTRFPAIIPPEVGRQTVTFSTLKARKVKVGGDYTPAISMAGLMPSLHHSYLLHTTEQTPVEIDVQSVEHGVSFGVYMVFKRGVKSPVTQGLLYPGRVVSFTGEAGSDYLVYIPRRGPVAAELCVKGAAAVRGRFDAKNGVLNLEPKDGATIYVYQHSDQVVSGEDGALLRAGSFSVGALKTRQGNVTEVPLARGWTFAPEQEHGEPPAASWKPIEVTSRWQEQGFGDYFGPAWYRTRFSLKATRPGGKALLYFGGVDGDAVVVLNRETVGERPLGEKFAGWNDSFYFDVSKALKDGENELFVRVHKKSEMYPGGIFGNVTLLYEQIQ